MSTDKQAEKDLSIPAQLQAMRQYAGDRGWTILNEFVESGASARTAERPVLRQLLSQCRDHQDAKVDVVLVHKLDRLARNLADHVAIRAQLRDRGVTLASVTESLEDSVSGHLVEHILAAMAEFYSANLSEEVKKGMRQKVMQGGWPHRPPRGYQIARSDQKSAIVVDEPEGALVRKAFELCLVGYQGIVDLRLRLASLGFRTKTGRPVSNASLVRLLTNPFYCGKLQWKKEIYPGAQPPLISPAWFEQVQQILKSRTRLVTRRPAKFLLTGLAHCSQCGALVGGEQHRRWRYYRCRGSFRASDRCRARYCRLDHVHQQLERAYQQVVLSAADRARIVRLATDAALEQDRRHQRRQSALRMQVAALVQREAHLTRAFGQGLLTADVHLSALQELAEERLQLGGQLTSPADTSSDQLKRLRVGLETARSARDLHILLALPEQRLLVRAVFEKLEIDHTGVVRYTFRRKSPATLDPAA